MLTVFEKLIQLWIISNGQEDMSDRFEGKEQNQLFRKREKAQETGIRGLAVE